MDLISCNYIGEGSVNSSMRKCKILEKINFFTYFRYGRNFADGKFAWETSSWKTQERPLKWWEWWFICLFDRTTKKFGRKIGFLSKKSLIENRKIPSVTMSKILGQLPIPVPRKWFHLQTFWWRIMVPQRFLLRCLFQKSSILNFRFLHPRV